MMHRSHLAIEIFLQGKFFFFNHPPARGHREVRVRCVSSSEVLRQDLKNYILGFVRHIIICFKRHSSPLSVWRAQCECRSTKIIQNERLLTSGQNRVKFGILLLLRFTDSFRRLTWLCHSQLLLHARISSVALYNQLDIDIRRTIRLIPVNNHDIDDDNNDDAKWWLRIVILVSAARNNNFSHNKDTSCGFPVS